jgi:hypothetical protein
MTRFRAFLREDQPILGLYSFQWLFVAGGLTVVWVLIFGPPAWIASAVWLVFCALVLGAAVIALLWVLVAVLILTCGYSK